MASAQQLKEWAAGCIKQAKVRVNMTTANSYRRLAQKLHELAVNRVARGAQGPPRRKDPSPSPDE
jgi:glutamine synthetase